MGERASGIEVGVIKNPDGPGSFVRVTFSCEINPAETLSLGTNITAEQAAELARGLLRVAAHPDVVGCSAPRGDRE